jgi:hypothetical protein
MKKGSGIYFLVFGLSVALFLIFYLQEEKKSFRWDETYVYNGKEPYDLGITIEFIKNLKGEENVSVLDVPFSDSSFQKKGLNYVLIGNQVFFDKNDRESFKNWVSEGNTALIITPRVPFFIKKMIDDKGVCLSDEKVYTKSLFDTVINTNHLHPKLRSNYPTAFKKKYKDRTQSYNFSYYNSALTCSSSNILSLGMLENRFANFIGIPIKKGMIYLRYTQESPFE